MKKVIISVLVVCLLAFTCSAFGDDLIAEILPSNIEIYYGYGGGTKLEVPTYSDGTAVYVPLETLMQMLGGSYEAQDGQVTITIDAEALPPLIAEVALAKMEPETSWEYLNYYYMDKLGIGIDQLLADYPNGTKIIEKIDKAIEQNVDINELLDALQTTLNMGGSTVQLDKLIK